MIKHHGSSCVVVSRGTECVAMYSVAYPGTDCMSDQLP